jgi:uncharacterized membrane protein
MSQYLKAFVGALIAFLTSLSTALVDDKSFSQITDGQWVVAVIALLTGFAAVWAVPNSPPSE